MKEDTQASSFALLASDGAFDPLEEGVRQRVRHFIEEILEEELQAALGRGRYERLPRARGGCRNGHRTRQVIGTFGAETVRVPRARPCARMAGTASEWRSQGAAPYQRLTKRAEALIAGAYLAGTNTRRVRRALVGAVRRRRRQGRGQPRLAQGPDRLGGMERPRSRRRGHRPADPGRHGGAGRRSTARRRRSLCWWR